MRSEDVSMLVEALLAFLRGLTIPFMLAEEGSFIMADFSTGAAGGAIR